MAPLLATTLGFGDFAIIAWIVVVFAGAAAYSARETARLRRMERKLDALLKHLGVPPAPIVPGELSDEVQDLALIPERRIEAIKLHREQTGRSLADAKRDVDAFIKRVE